MLRGLPAALVLLLGVGSPQGTFSREQPMIFSESWIDGTLMSEPALQVQQIDRDTFVLRQSLRTNFEGPFMYLLLGDRRAFLLDSGAGGINLRPAVDRLIAAWLAERDIAPVELVVAHSHAHGDHVGGDKEFAARPKTQVVGHSSGDVARFFKVKKWPNSLGKLDLGGRMLKIIPTPGHQDAHIMIYDPRLEVMLSGDALYPGRLYIPENRAVDARASVNRVKLFLRGHPARAFLGAHIEMSRIPRVDYSQGQSAHQDERRLELPASAIGDLSEAMQGPLTISRGRIVRDHFIVVPVPAVSD